MKWTLENSSLKIIIKRNFELNFAIKKTYEKKENTGNRKNNKIMK
jgi:hypothetical protein